MALSYEIRDGKAVWGGRTLEEWVPLVVDALVREFDPVEVILFGSAANGTDGPDSDLDFLVVLDEAPRAQRVDLMVQLKRATRACRVPRDLLVTSEADMRSHRDAVGTIEYEAASEGSVLYERTAA